MRPAARLLRLIVVAAVVIPAITNAEPLQGQEGSDSGVPWIVYEQGVQQLRERDYGLAMQSFRRAIQLRGGAFPEAEAGIGRVFAAENTVQLAERQFRRALDQEQFFYVPAQEYAVRYELAALYRNRGSEGRFDYEAALKEIVADDPSFSDPDNQNLRSAYLRTLRNDGINRLLVLYRIQENFARRAHHLLGEHFLASRNFDTAAEHLMYASLMVFSTAIEEYRRFNPSYQFETLSGFLSRLGRREEIRSYLEQADAYRTLYSLGTALYGADLARETPREIWRVLADRPEAGRWASLASQQLADPRADRYVVY
ncbi:MAG: hypothetical protein GVY29_00300 [Spirochaetes bacterium]|jgi:tetratricopeptide (TPR) repeat protein|nr:hypothetical protein [Spirochaetota bacterium]